MVKGKDAWEFIEKYFNGSSLKETVELVEGQNELNELKFQIEISDAIWESFMMTAKVGDLICFDNIPWPDEINVLGVLPTHTRVTISFKS